jgi:hypothetical protein
MGPEEKLRAWAEAARELTVTKGRVELEGTGGLSLVMLVKVESSNANLERVYLQLRSRDNQTLSSVATGTWAVGLHQNAKWLESAKVKLVEKLVDGDDFNLPMAVILVRRAEEKRRRLAELRRAADQVPDAMVESAEATQAAVWVESVTREVEAPAV